MSLKAGAKRSAARGSFLEFGFESFETELAAGAVGMWESRSDFQGLWETEENLGLVFLVFHAPVISTVLPGFFHALLLCWKRANSLRLAFCIPTAAWVSDSIPAVRASSSIVRFGRRNPAKPGNCRKISHGVAYQR